MYLGVLRCGASVTGAAVAVVLGKDDVAEVDQTIAKSIKLVLSAIDHAWQLMPLMNFVNHHFKVQTGTRIRFSRHRVMTEHTQLHVGVSTPVRRQCSMTTVAAVIGDDIAMCQTRV